MKLLYEAGGRNNRIFRKGSEDALRVYNQITFDTSPRHSHREPWVFRKRRSTRKSSRRQRWLCSGRSEYREALFVGNHMGRAVLPRSDAHEKTLGFFLDFVQAIAIRIIRREQWVPVTPAMSGSNTPGP
jgi:hypothetical protein